MFEIRALCFEVSQPLYSQGPEWLLALFHTLSDWLWQLSSSYHVASRVLLPETLIERLSVVSPLKYFFLTNHLTVSAMSSVFGFFTLTSLFLSLASHPSHIPIPVLGVFQPAETRREGRENKLAGSFATSSHFDKRASHNLSRLLSSSNLYPEVPRMVNYCIEVS